MRRISITKSDGQKIEDGASLAAGTYYGELSPGDFECARLGSFLFRWDSTLADGTLDDMGDAPVSNLPNSWASYPITLTAPVEVAVGDSFFFELVASAAGLMLATVAINRHHPIP